MVTKVTRALLRTVRAVHLALQEERSYRLPPIKTLCAVPFGEKLSAIVIILPLVSHLLVVLALTILHLQLSYWTHCSFIVSLVVEYIFCLSTGCSL